MRGKVAKIITVQPSKFPYEGHYESAPMSMPSSPYRSFGKKASSLKRPEMTRLRQQLPLWPSEEASKKCRDPHWHSRVWIESGKHEINLQLCHVCKVNCQRNYRNDLSKHFKPKSSANNSAAIIWYRFFAR